MTFLPIAGNEVRRHVLSWKNTRNHWEEQEGMEMMRSDGKEATSTRVLLATRLDSPEYAYIRVFYQIHATSPRGH